MSAIDWATLLLLERSATPGPWDCSAVGDVYDDENRKLFDSRDMDDVPFGKHTREESQANAEFVAEVRGAFPALVALVRQIVGALERLERDGCWCGDAPDMRRHEAHCVSARAALATIPAALRAGVGDGE